jgi:hypothetical protein
MTIECAREQDVLDALAAQRWPARCDADLRTHVTACAICADLVAVAAALVDEHETAWRAARVPPSGVVWWRAQLRAREEAARAAARPIAFVQGVAASCAVWLVVAILRAVPLRSMPDWRGWAGGLTHELAGSLPDVAQVMALLPGGILFLVMGGAWLLLAPVAIYFVVRED